MRTGISIALFLALLFAGGCSWVGRTAGKTQAAVEDSVDDVKGGYRSGYRTEKAKTQPKEKTQGTPTVDEHGAEEIKPLTE